MKTELDKNTKIQKGLFTKDTEAKLQKWVAEFKKTGIPNCINCGKKYKKIKKESGKYNSVWKPGCKCMPSSTRLCVG
jgi:hypothetical protein